MSDEKRTATERGTEIHRLLEEHYLQKDHVEHLVTVARSLSRWLHEQGKGGSGHCRCLNAAIEPFKSTVPE